MGENMKISTKAVLLAIILFFVFYFFNRYILYAIGFMITVGGDDYELSYHMFSYTGIAFIASLVVTCTYIIVKKIEEVLHEIKELKQQKK